MMDTVLKGNVDTEYTIVTNARHYQSLMKVASSLLEIKQGLRIKHPEIC